MIETSEDTYAGLIRAYRDAREHANKAGQVAAEAQRALGAALAALETHEAKPGVPAWQHLQVAPSRDECRLGGGDCRVHWPHRGSPWFDHPAAAGPPDEAEHSF